jgi:hypothetical protein
VQVLKNFEKVDGAKVTPAAHFSNDLGLDSLDAVEVRARRQAGRRAGAPRERTPRARTRTRPWTCCSGGGHAAQVAGAEPKRTTC